MGNFNKVILLGNLTRDPELRYTQGGQAIAKFGLAVNRTYTINGEKKEQTCFVDITAFGKQAEILSEHCTKGRPLFIEGRLEFNAWEKDGQKQSKLSVVVENFQFMGDRGGSGDGGGGQKPSRAKMREAAATAVKRSEPMFDDDPIGDSIPY